MDGRETATMETLSLGVGAVKVAGVRVRDIAPGKDVAVEARDPIASIEVVDVRREKVDSAKADAKAHLGMGMSEILKAKVRAVVGTVREPTTILR